MNSYMDKNINFVIVWYNIFGPSLLERYESDDNIRI